jgi:hypothetical protein
MDKRVMAGIGAAVFLLAAMAGAATITATPSNPNLEESVTFELVTSPAPASVNWNFGDGHAQAGGVTTWHTYLQTGTFTVTASWTGGKRPRALSFRRDGG